MEHWDVIIAGGGPAGISTGLHLLQRDPGWAGRVLVLEKARYPRHKLCGGGITEYGRQSLQRLGLDLAEVPHVPIDEVRLTYGGASLSFWKRPVLHIVRRDEFDAWLAAKAIARGLVVRQGEAVTDVTFDGEGADVHTSAGTYRARTVVAADGSKGVVRRKLGLEDGGHVARLIEIITPAGDPASRELHSRRVALFDFDPVRAGLQGYYWDFPCLVKGQPHVNRGVFDARIVADAPKADLKQVLGQALAARGIDLASCELMGHPIHWFDARGAFARPHGLLAGDAAGADPFLGEGIAFALGYGEVAAEAIADAFARADFSYRDYGARFLASEHGRGLKLRADLAGLFYRVRNPLVHRLVLEGFRVAMHIVPAMRPYRTALPPAAFTTETQRAQSGTE